MSQAGETFFTSIGCMDGRVQDPIEHFGQKFFGAKYPDTITEAGLVGLLSKDSADQYLRQSIKKKILISLEKHHSKGIIVHGHEDCAGNPVDEEQHKKDVLKSVQTIKELVKKDIQIIQVFVKRKGHNWIVEELRSFQ